MRVIDTRMPGAWARPLIVVAACLAAVVALAVPSEARWRLTITPTFTRTPVPATPTATQIGPARAAAASSGNVILVPSQVSTLQAAIAQVVNGGVIELAAGTYASPSGGWVINDRAKAFTIRAAAGATVTLDGGGARDILRLINSSVGAGRPVTFENLIFANGRSVTDGIAGGVTIQRGEATFVGCTFQNNSNTSNTGGGGTVVARLKAFFSDCLWSNNSARTTGGGLALATDSRAVIHNSRLLNNRTNLPNHLPTAAGGGIHVTNSSLRVSNTRFEGNRAGYVGGGLYVLGSWQDPVSTPRAEAVIANCPSSTTRRCATPRSASRRRPRAAECTPRTRRRCASSTRA
jgi:hypothetical protein